MVLGGVSVQSSSGERSQLLACVRTAFVGQVGIEPLFWSTESPSQGVRDPCFH